MKKKAFKDRKPNSVAMLHKQSRMWGINEEAEFFRRWGEELQKLRERRRRYCRAHRIKYRDKMLEYHRRKMKEYRASYPDKARAVNRKCYAKHREARVEYARAARKKMKNDPAALEKYREYVRVTRRAREQNDINFRLMRRIRGRILGALKYGTAKSSKTTVLLGCTIPQLRAFIERQWLPGMSWENHGKGEGKWHLDHRQPCSSFDLTKPSQQRICFHYTNLQPLWEKDNLLKGSKTLKQAELGLAI